MLIVMSLLALNVFKVYIFTKEVSSFIITIIREPEGSVYIWRIVIVYR